MGPTRPLQEAILADSTEQAQQLPLPTPSLPGAILADSTALAQPVPLPTPPPTLPAVEPWQMTQDVRAATEKQFKQFLEDKATKVLAFKNAYEQQATEEWRAKGKRRDFEEKNVKKEWTNMESKH